MLQFRYMNIPPVFEPSVENEVASGIFKTKIDGLFYIVRKKFIDERGYFSDITSLKNLEKAIGRVLTIKQINVAYSQTNVVRGLHAEGWNKLVTTFTGKGFSALVDIRPDSPTFKQVEYFLFEPGAAKDTDVSLYIPMGVANSICAIEGPVLYHYAVDAFYDERDPAGDKALTLFDPELNIQWPIPREQMILSQRDVDSSTLQDLLKQRA